LISKKIVKKTLLTGFQYD